MRLLALATTVAGGLLVLAGPAAAGCADEIQKVKQALGGAGGKAEGAQVGSDQAAGKISKKEANLVRINLYVAEELLKEEKEDLCLERVAEAQELLGVGKKSAAQQVEADQPKDSSGDELQAEPSESWHEGEHQPNPKADPGESQQKSD